jgi:hypothetical protein
MPRESSKTGRKKQSAAPAPSSALTAEPPELVIDRANLPAAATQLANRLSAAAVFFQRAAALMKIVETGRGPVALPVNIHDVVTYGHRVCRPIFQKIVGGEIVQEPVTLPDRVARLYLNLHDSWGVGELNGICRAPILSDDGAIRVAEGYDPGTGYWCVGVEAPNIPTHPSRQAAEKALRTLRGAFATFPFADASMATRPDGKAILDLSKPPGIDESTQLTAILTAVCRPSLPLAPGFIFRSPQYSGAGTGKGKLVRAIARIAYNIAPRPFTSPGERPELEKRLTASLVAADPVIFLDNVNSETLKSNLLAQMATENPCAIRPFGVNTKMVTVSTNAFIGITGNAIRAGEDLTRRLLFVNLDAGCEDPERRTFDGDFLGMIEKRRSELLAAALTIWRWGRRNRVKAGLPLGSFEQWAGWCRDPLIALGCADPVSRIVDAKRDDPDRLQLLEFFKAWHNRYGERAVRVSEIDLKLRQLADGHGGSRQKFATFVANLTGTRAAGFVMTRNVPIGKWSPATYALSNTEG